MWLSMGHPRAGPSASCRATMRHPCGEVYGQAGALCFSTSFLLLSPSSLFSPDSSATLIGLAHAHLTGRPASAPTASIPTGSLTKPDPGWAASSPSRSATSSASPRTAPTSRAQTVSPPSSADSPRANFKATPTLRASGYVAGYCSSLHRPPASWLGRGGARQI